MNKKSSSLRKPLIAGNWKMHGTRAAATALFKSLVCHAQLLNRIELAVFPPCIFLQQTEQALQNTTISWGGQNICVHPQGAYTGEIAAEMLKEFGCRYVLLGHSERRMLHGEDNACVAAKYVRALQAGLTPILCIGETLAERQAENTIEVVKQQLNSVIESAIKLNLSLPTVIAYEPIWAIGTGETATPEQAQAVHFLLRQHFAQWNLQAAQELRILYGGSVKPENAAALFAMPDVDGGLIGKASLDAQQFLDIAQLCNNLY